MLMVIFVLICVFMSMFVYSLIFMLFGIFTFVQQIHVYVCVYIHIDSCIM